MIVLTKLLAHSGSVSVQVYGKLPLQKLSGYIYDVEDFEPYPCLPKPVPGPEPEPEPERLLSPEEATRTKRSFFYEPPEPSDVYSIFKV